MSTEWNGTPLTLANHRPSSALTEQQVARTPDAVALVMAEESPSDKWQVAK
ncbi:MAG: hypothetical protein R3E79_00210 [Caldilineaceae bacterium]